MNSLETIEKIAKDIIETIGRHSPQAIIEKKDGSAALIILQFDEDTKQTAINLLRKACQDSEATRCFVIVEGWYITCNIDDHSLPYIRPSKRKDRKEVLTISEFKRDMNNRQVLLPFRREGEKIIWETRTETKDFDTLWNPFLEEGGLKERFDKKEKSINEDFLKGLASEFYKKIKADLEKANTPDETAKVLQEKLLPLMKEKMKEVEEMKIK